MRQHSRIGVVRQRSSFFVVLFFTATSLLAASPARAATPVVGSLPGNFGITSTGAASYSIPIAVPRGSGGLTPSIALVYNSQSGSGAAGYGWTLSGLSAITRCNKTIHDDGATEGVSLTSSDDYCLDGQRLILKSDGTYDTEIESFSRITATSGTNGPASFTVQTRNGETWEYGNTTDSRILATGTSTVRVWALDKVTDANGNYYTLTYQNNDTTTGDFWPLHIDYTGNTAAGTSPLHKIQFDWTPRATGSVTGRYLKGSLITQTQLLHAVEVRYNGSTTFTYTLAYQTDSATQRNQLTSVQECAADGSCYAPTTIAWQNGAAGWQADTIAGGSAPDQGHAASAHLMDVDGDGIADLVYPGSSYWMVMFGNPSGGFGTPVSSGRLASTLYQFAVAINFRGNGRTSLLYPADDNTWHVLDATGGKTTGSIFNDVATGISDQYGSGPDTANGMQIADYWGHGLSDILYSDGTNTYIISNTGGNFSAPQVLISGSSWTLRGPAGMTSTASSEFTDSSMNFDGSGRTGTVNLVVTDHPDGAPTYTWYAATPSGSNYASAGSFGGNDIADPVPFPINLKGDGTSDLVASHAISNGIEYTVYLSTGTSMQEQRGFVTGADPTTNVMDDLVAADYYANGRQELLFASQGQWAMYGLQFDASTGQPSLQEVDNISAPYPSNYVPGSVRIGSIEANGLDDLVYAVPDSEGIIRWHYRLHAGAAPDLVTGVTDGMGNTWQPEYTSLLNGGTTYSLPAAGATTYGTGATTYTVQNASIPLQVVSSYIASNGVGGTYTKTFTYSGGKLSSDGLGFLGFATRTLKDSRNSVKTTENYQQNWPFVGYLESETVTQSNGNILQQLSNNYLSPACSAGYTPGDLCFPHLSTRTITRYDTDGSLLTTVTTSNSSFDSYGDITDQTVQTTDATTSQTFTSETQTDYWQNTSPSDYCLTLPTQITVTRTNPHGSMQRISGQIPDSGYCRPHSITLSEGTESDPSITGTATPVTTTYGYDAWGNVHSTTVSASDITGTMTRTTTTDYTTYRGEYPDKITNALNQSSTLSWYPDLGLKHTVTDPNGHATTWGYDPFGRVTHITKPDGSAANWTYSAYPGNDCPSGTTTQCYSIAARAESSDGKTLPLGSTDYDAEGRVFRQQKTLLGGVLSTVQTTYNALGEVTSVSKPFLPTQSPQYATNYSNYDVLGRLGRIAQPANANDASNSDITNITYDGFTTIRTLQAPNGSVASETSSKTTDAFGDVVGTTDSNGTETTYAYDAFGDLVSTAVGGHTTTLTYDGFGHKLTMSDPDMGHWVYTYDALGELHTQTDAKGQEIEQFYDSLGRIYSRKEFIKAGGTQTVADSWCYDGPVDPTTPGTCATSNVAPYIGLPASVSDSNGFSKQYSYDSLSRPDDLTTSIGGSVYDVSTTYDSFGRVETVSYPESVTPVTVPAPTAAATAIPASVVMGHSVTLDGSGSTDPNGLPLQYQWTQSAGSNVTLSDAASSTPSFTGNAIGIDTFQLIVRDASASSAPVSVSVSVTPGAPGTVSVSPATSTTGNYTVSWDTAVGAASYTLYESVDGGAYTAIASDLSGTSESFSSKGDTTANTTYSYKVKACANGVCGPDSPIANATVTLPPTEPDALSASPNPSTNGSYTLSWAAASGNTSSYIIYESLNGGSYSAVASGLTGTSRSFSGKGSSSANDIYSYKVAACNGSVCSAQSAAVTETVTYPPATPAAPSVPTTSTNGSYTVSWAKPSGVVSGYTLYESVNGGSYSVAASGLTGTSRSFSGKGSGSTNDTYSYKVAACNGSVCSSQSAAASVTVVYAPGTPAAPSLSVNPSTNGSYTVSWAKPSGVVSGYTLYESVNGGSYSAVASGLTGTNRSFSGKGSSSANDTYSYKVAACNGAVCSAQSTSVTETVTYPPAAPGTLIASENPSTDGSYSVSWTVPLNGVVSGYELYESTSSTFSSQTRIYSGTATQSAVSGKGNGDYYYRVRACNATVCSAYSSTLDVLVTLPPGAPNGIGVSPNPSSNGSYTVSWNAPISGLVTSYTLYESMNGGSYAVSASGLTGTSKSFSGKGSTSVNDTYSYQVDACNQGACTASGTASVTVMYPPATPTAPSVPATSTNGSYTVSWTKPSGVVSSYTVYESVNGGSYSTVASGLTGTSRSFSGKGSSSSNYTYSYKVAACNGSACGAQSSASAAVTVMYVPSTPATPGLSVNPSTNGSYTVSWTKPSGVVSGYTLYESVNGGSYSTVASGLTGTSRSFSGKGSSSVNDTYSYKVAACNGSACGTQSAAVAETVAYPPGVPGAPSVSPTTSTNGSYTVVWTRPSSSVVSEYKVYESVNGGSYSQVATPGTNSQSFSGKGSQSQNDTYTYKVTACNTPSSNCGNYSATASVTVVLPPGEPSSISLPGSSNWDGSFTVSWGAAAGLVSTYHVQLGTYDGELHRYEWLSGNCGTSSSGRSCSFGSSAVSNGTYYAHVYACNSSSCGADRIASNEITVARLSPPSAPSLSGTGTTYTGSVALSWSAPANATSYRLYAQYYSRSAGSWSSYTQKYSGGSRSWSQTLTSDQKYAHYYVQAYDAAGGSGNSNTVTTTYAVPAAPSLSGPSSTTDGSIILSWSVPSGSTSYALYRATQSRAYGTWSSYSVIYSGSSHSYTDTIGGTKSAARYYVEACNGIGCGSNSNTLTVTYSLTGGGGGGCKFSCTDPKSVEASDTSSPAPAPSTTAAPATAPDSAPADDGTTTDTPPPSDGGPLAMNTDATRTAAPRQASRPPINPAANRTLLALQQTRQQLLGHTLQQPSEQAMQAAADRRAEARLATVVPPAPAADRRQWETWQAAQQQAHPNGPRYAPPAYLAYADARIKPATTTPYRFTVQYVYNPASGALAMVANADTGFIYWQAALYSGNAPVDAWGHLLGATDGNGVSTISVYDQATGAPTGLSTGSGVCGEHPSDPCPIQTLVYTWDGFGNLTQRQDANRNLSESFQYDALNRLTHSQVTNPQATNPSLALVYDMMGNIASKSDAGTYSYGDASHPHAVTAITDTTGSTVYSASYDANGNQTLRNGHAVTWNVDNLPTEIQSATGSSTFAYGPAHQRYQQSQSDGTVTTYIGGLYEVVSTNGGATVQYRHNIVAGGETVAVHTLDQSGNASTSYLHHDHLGSVDAITDDTGAVTQRMSFDAFGQRRDAANWTNDLTPSDIASLKDTTDRGFTNQEQLDNVGLVHMNGRVYDPQIGRFISADPTIPNPMFSQAFNRYSYVYNSPLTYVDPSGFSPNDIYKDYPTPPPIVIGFTQAPVISAPPPSSCITINLQPIANIGNAPIDADPIPVNNAVIPNPDTPAPGAPAGGSQINEMNHPLYSEQELTAETYAAVMDALGGTTGLKRADSAGGGAGPTPGRGHGPQTPANLPRTHGVATGPMHPGQQPLGTVGAPEGVVAATDATAIAAAGLETVPEFFKKLEALPLGVRLRLIGKGLGFGALGMTVIESGINGYSDYKRGDYEGAAHEALNVGMAGALLKGPALVKGTAAGYFIVNDTVGWGAFGNDLFNLPSNYTQLQSLQATQQIQQAQGMQQLENSGFPGP